MQRRKFLLQVGAGIGAYSLSHAAFAQAYPSQPIRLVVPFPAGGPTDSFARLYAAQLGKVIGQPVVVENRSGAAGAIGSNEVRRSTPDGHTLLFGTASTHALYTLVQPKPLFDALTDFDFVGVLGGAPAAFAVQPSMPRTLKSLVIASRHNPGKYTYGSPGTGTFLHVAAERMKKIASADFRHVPYKGSAPATQDLLGGQIHMTVDTLGGLLPHHRGGRLRIIAVATEKRLATHPDIPTVAESADVAEGFSAMLWNVVTAPKGTPPAVLQHLIAATRTALEDPETRARLEAQTMFVDLHLGEQGRRYVEEERRRLKPIVDGLDLKT